MDGFTTDNTEGFSAAQLATMNDEYCHNLQIALCELPDGAEGTDQDTLDQIKQSVAEAILKRHGGA